MRIDQAHMIEITGRKRASSQAAWFRDYLGVTVPCDRLGPIVTVAAYEALVARACGLPVQAALGPTGSRPSVRLREPKE